MPAVILGAVLSAVVVYFVAKSDNFKEPVSWAIGAFVLMLLLGSIGTGQSGF